MIDSYLLSKTTSKFFRDSFGHRHGGHPARLCAAYLAFDCVAHLGQVLGDLGRLARASLTDHNQHLIGMDSLQPRNSSLNLPQMKWTSG